MAEAHAHVPCSPVGCVGAFPSTLFLRPHVYGSRTPPTDLHLPPSPAAWLPRHASRPIPALPACLEQPRPVRCPQDASSSLSWMDFPRASMSPESPGCLPGQVAVPFRFCPVTGGGCVVGSQIATFTPWFMLTPSLPTLVLICFSCVSLIPNVPSFMIPLL